MLEPLISPIWPKPAHFANPRRDLKDRLINSLTSNPIYDGVYGELDKLEGPISKFRGLVHSTPRPPPNHTPNETDQEFTERFGGSKKKAEVLI